MKNFKDIYKITSSAKLLAMNNHDMTAQVINDELTILEHECEVLILSGVLSPRNTIEGNKELIKAIEDCEEAMNQAEDALEYHYSRFPTDL